MGKPNADKKLFFDTIKDMRELIAGNTNSYISETLGVNKKKSPKVPYNHLIGRRRVIKDKYKQQMGRAKQQSIQYDSSMNLLQHAALKQSSGKGSDKGKDEFERNQYKFTGQKITDGRIGRESNGFLEIRKQDIDKIYGRAKIQRDTTNNGKQKSNKKMGKFKNNKKGGNKKGGNKNKKITKRR